MFNASLSIVPILAFFVQHLEGVEPGGLVTLVD